MRVDDSWYTVMNKNCYRARGAFQALDEQNKGLKNIPTICFNLLKYRIQDSVVGKALTTANQPDQDRVTPNYLYHHILYHTISYIYHHILYHTISYYIIYISSHTISYYIILYHIYHTILYLYHHILYHTILYHHIFVISHALSPFRPGFRSINIKHK
jgi:hypothetical protein